MSKFNVLLVTSLFLLLAGCASQDIPDPDMTDETYDGQGADTDCMDSGGLGEGEMIDYDPTAGELADVVYFDFDSYELLPEDADIAARHGLQLSEDSSLSVRLEGHADERGSREYNLALGERRALTVRKQLVLLGASAGQVRAVSYGEERPVSERHDEESYALNRRVEILY